MKTMASQKSAVQRSSFTEKRANKEMDMTRRARAEARIRRAERIVEFLFDVIFPVFTRASESKRAA